MKLHVISSSSKGNGYVLESQSEALVLEAGCKYKDCLRAIQYKYSKICGGLLSHVHKDHSEYITDYLKAGIPFFTNDETAENIQIISGEKIMGMMERWRFPIGSFSVIPFYLPHDVTPNYGYIIEHCGEMGKLLFMTDFEYCKYVFKKQRINHILIECNHLDNMLERDSAKYEHVLRGHASLNTVTKFLEANKTNSLRTVVLMHLSGDSADEEIMLQEVQNVVGRNVVVKVAKPGMSLEVNELPF